MSFNGLKRNIEEGDTVILYVGVTQIYAIKVEPTILNRHGIAVENTFQTKYGALRVMSLVGKSYGSKVSLSKGYAYALYPSAELWTLTLPHRTQILYSPDISMVIMELDIHCGSVVCEAGTGSGSLSHAILRAIGPSGHLYTSDFHQERVIAAQNEFDAHGYGSRVTVKRQDVCVEGWGVTELADAIFLDLPKPWEALCHALLAIKKKGGRICSFSPCVEQVSKTSECMRKLGLTNINTVENLQREFQFRTMSLPSVAVKKLPVDQLRWMNEEKITGENNVKRHKVENIEEPQNLTEQSSTIQESTTGDICNISTECEDVSINSKSQIKIDANPPLTTANGMSAVSLTSKTNSEPKDYKFHTGIPLLKMPGHTGYLTFATVSPSLNRELSISNLQNK